MPSYHRIEHCRCCCPGGIRTVGRRPDGCGNGSAAAGQPIATRSAAGHGSISIGYFNSYANDLLLRSNLKASSVIGKYFGSVHLQGTGLDVAYNVSDDWTLSGGIRYFTGRYSGPAVNCPTTAPPQCAHAPVVTPPKPDAPFIDDGNYHGAWQDWHIGAAWHTNIGSYFITPSVTAYIPTHSYPTYGNAYVGQDLHQLLVGAQLQHQFELTNFGYSLSYYYAWSEHVLGINTGYERADAELDWFVNEKFKIDGFLTGREGFGIRANTVLPKGGSPVGIKWYERERLVQHNYHAVGVGFGYDLNSRYTVSASIQHEFWGDSVFNFPYALEAYVTRNF